MSEVEKFMFRFHQEQTMHKKYENFVFEMRLCSTCFYDAFKQNDAWSMNSYSKRIEQLRLDARSAWNEFIFLTNREREI